MRTIYKNVVLSLLILGFMAGSIQSSKGCDRSRLTLDSITPGPSGSYYIYLRLCVGAGILGLLKGADGNTGRFLFSFSSSSPSFSVMSFTTPIRSNFTNIPYNGVNVGAQPAFNARQAIFFNNTANWFTCITTTTACGAVNTECDQVRFQVNMLPDSIRIYGIEGGDNLFGGCYPNITMLVDLTNLPVEWQDVGCRQVGSGMNVNWATRTETNNLGFKVERSADGVSFSEVGNLGTESSNSSQLKEYQFFDPNPVPGVNFYRIQQVDIDGTTSASEIVSGFYTPMGGLAWESVSPVPAEDFLNLVYRSDVEAAMTLELTDLQGKQLLVRKIETQIGQNQLSMDVSDVAPGMYLLRLYNTAGILEKKIVVM